MRSRRITILLISLTIIGIGSFQAYWIHKIYNEESRLLQSRADILFRESVLRLQIARMHLDSAQVKVEDNNGVFLFRQSLKDTAGNLRDTVSISDADSVFRLALKKEGIDLSWHLTLLKTSAPGLPELPELRHGDRKMSFDVQTIPHSVDRSSDDTIRVGLVGPTIFLLHLTGGSGSYVLKRITPQIGFSLLLVLLTIGSFWLLYRNWRQQTRLTMLKNDFIGNITHELKTPIATVSVAVEALRNFNALQDPERTREYLDISANELQRLSLLVDKVLKLSLFERHEIELKNSLFNLRELVQEVTASMRLQFERSAATLTLDAQGSDFHLKADKLHITSVIFNLLDNALKYTPVDPRIRITLAEDTGFTTMTVTDNGIGIPQEYRKKIFEKFFRVPTGDRHNIKGYGLGLSYVSYVLQRHGGEISVESREGSGSSFTVKLPRGYE